MCGTVDGSCRSQYSLMHVEQQVNLEYTRKRGASRRAGQGQILP
jgi:hypothetical protein